MKIILTLQVLFIIYFSPNVGLSQVTDIDGNSYNTVVIGDTEWMVENLRTNRYSNGDAIVPFSDGASWGLDSEGKWVRYNHSAENESIYGKLYNWYAVADPRGLCPVGWKVPDQSDWDALALFVDPEIWGNNNVVGMHLKSRRQQNSPHGGEFETNAHPRWDGHETRFGNDTYGFAVLPAGAYLPFHGFMNQGSYGYIWTSTAHSEEYSLASVFLNSHRGMSKSAYHKSTGLSVRCIKGASEPTFTLSLSVEPENGGSTQGAGQYAQGQEITLVAQPASGFSFVEWRDEDGSTISSNATFSFFMPANNRSIVAIYLQTQIEVPEFPWVEDFEGSVFPPEGWITFNESGALRNWQLSPVQNHTPSGSQSALHNFGPVADGIQKGWLVTPVLEIPANGQFELSFWSYNNWPSWYDKNSVLISTQSGNPQIGDFTEVWVAPNVSSVWGETKVSLAPYAGHTIYIAFFYQSLDGHSWFLDDVSVRVAGQ